MNSNYHQKRYQTWDWSNDRQLIVLESGCLIWLLASKLQKHLRLWVFANALLGLIQCTLLYKPVIFKFEHALFFANTVLELILNVSLIQQRRALIRVSVVVDNASSPVWHVLWVDSQTIIDESGDITIWTA